jgi:hypothetical protein
VKLCSVCEMPLISSALPAPTDNPMQGGHHTASLP